VPRAAVGSPEIAALAAAAESGDTDAKKQLTVALHGAMGDVKAEARQLLAKHGVTQMTMKPVLRQYAFENKAVRPGKQWVLKVRYPASQPAIPLGASGDAFSAVFGANQSSLEALLLKRRVMGPSWIALRQPRRVDPGAQVSYCRLEVEVEGHKAVFAAAAGSRPAPPLTVAAVHLKTATNPSNGANEVVAASVVYLPRVNTDGPTPFARRDLRHFSAVRKLDGVGFPAGFDAEVRSANGSDLGRRNGGAVLAMQPNERALLTMLVMRLRDLDADVYVGHNFAAYDLDVMLHRMQALRVPHWAALGRLKRSKFPNLGGSGHTFGGGAGAGQLSVVAGRLLCDTYLSARDLVRETDYTLTTLAKNLLGETRSELASSDIPAKFSSCEKLMDLVRLTECDAWLSLRLAFYLVILPLSRQLAELSGSLWSKALLNQRAQRIEYLLLHEFHNGKFLLPDKLSAREKERLEKAAAAAAGDDDDEEDRPRPGAGKKGGKGPQYAGGLVLEPKKGLYERYILLLDFNSLYPSIIQEYNICFTTVERPEGGGVPALPEPSEERAPLPRVIGALVARRRRVKDLIKGERDPVRAEQLNIRQQALKLLANSMYGCLGFSNSRFFARPLAELITSQGREILQSTVDLVQGTMGKEVVYGDTDSIMINTDSEALPEVIALGQAIKKEVNKRYRLLEIEMDGVFKCMLLLKKKKYAAVKVERGADGTETETVEAKGLDMVRRDWCPLAKQASQFALDRILSCRSGVPREEVVAAIHDHLTALAAAVHAGSVPLNKYVITKQLTKRPDDYPDAKNQPHVQVALHRRAAGKRDGVLAGETVPYVICVEVGEDGVALPPAKGLAERAYAPEEVNASNGRLKVDADYYVGQQVFPVVSRLVAPIDGTDAARIAESLGLDPSRYRGVGGGAVGSREDALAAAAAGLDDDDRFKSCDPLLLTSPSGKAFEFRGVRDLLKRGDAAAVEAALLPHEDAAAAARPLTPAQLSNQVQLRLREAVGRYYEGRLRSDDDVMPCPTRNVCLREAGDGGRPGGAPPDLRCSGTMHQEDTEAALYAQLQYVHRLFDVEGALHALGDSKDARAAAEAKLAPIRAELDAGAAAARKIRDRSAYRWIDLSSVFGAAA
jgi:DNA polymerase alpha subunit A